MDKIPYVETPECELQPENYSPDAIHRALNRSTFTRHLAADLFKGWLHLQDIPHVTQESADKAIARCFDLADLFRRNVDHYHKAQLDFCQNELGELVKDSKLILPRAGTLKDMYPNGSFPGVS